METDQQEVGRKNSFHFENTLCFGIICSEQKKVYKVSLVNQQTKPGGNQVW